MMNALFWLDYLIHIMLSDLQEVTSPGGNCNVHLLIHLGLSIYNT